MKKGIFIGVLVVVVICGGIIFGVIKNREIDKSKSNEETNSNSQEENIKKIGTYNGELKQGAEYTDGQYTYRYKQCYNGTELMEWANIEEDGWGVHITDPNATDDVTTELCTEINGKPIVSMSKMFLYSKAKKVDVSSFDTSNVIDMNGMFRNSEIEEIVGLNKFDTAKVTTMENMFTRAKVKELDLSSFNTSKVENFKNMFSEAKNLTSLNVKSFDTSSVKNFGWMFSHMNMTEIDISNFDFSSNEGEKLKDNMMCIFTNGNFEKIYVKDEETKTLLESYNNNSETFGAKKFTGEFIVKE